MDKALEILANIIDKLKVKEVVTALLIACLVILFVSDKILGTLGLVDWRNKHRTEIGGALLLCGILCLIWIVTWIFNRVRSGNGAAKRVSRAYLKKINIY